MAAEAPPAAASAAVQAQPVALPAGAVEVGLTGTLKVTPPGVTFLRDVATVRAAGPDAGATTTAATFVVDFGVPLTVSAIWFPPSSSTSGPNTVTAASLWLGTQFVPISPGGPDGGFPVDQNSMASLGELQTQKLQVSLAQELDPADAQSQGLVNLPAAPASVQISLNGVPAWRSPPGAPPLPGAPAEVDLSAALAAVAAAAAGPVSVTVTVSAPSPLQEPALSLNAPTYLLEFAALPSPQVPALELDAPQEGAYQLTLPLPGAAATWPVREVLLTLAGRPPATRVLEPTLPVLAQTAFLGLQPGTTLAAALPAAWLAKLQTLTALRIPLSVTASGDPAGIELAPVLYSRDGPAGPLSPLPGANLAAVTVPAADGGDAPQWVALQLAEPLPVVPGQQLWLALGVVRGSATWLTAAPGPAAGPDAPLGRAHLLRRLPRALARRQPGRAVRRDPAGRRAAGRSRLSRPGRRRAPGGGHRAGRRHPHQHRHHGADAAGRPGDPERGGGRVGCAAPRRGRRRARPVHAAGGRRALPASWRRAVRRRRAPGGADTSGGSR